ncbi:SEL1-like repeat protein [Henriciella mobilis]|uniref:HTH cro/C1-type domain-containing protein n=1 Tax=Henriciella mobilis TaxID=2305467 RepID=A0A399RA39_9PROT|nr:SEL1-like repeat protein [Henriciella mobilis]RIJ28436.1 hypothetical protein D1223_13710 [Henriciella mobilis]
MTFNNLFDLRSEQNAEVTVPKQFLSDEIFADHLREAAKAGSNQARVLLYKSLVENRQAEALNYLNDAVQSGDAEALFLKAFPENQTIPEMLRRDQSEVKALIRRSAELGYKEAQFLVARDCFLQGLGKELNVPDEAFFWAERAARQGHAGAEYMLAELHAYDHHQSANVVRSMRWLVDAAEHGNLLAMADAAIIQLFMLPGFQELATLNDPIHSLEQIAKVESDSDGITSLRNTCLIALATIYRDGLGVPVSSPLSRKWFEKIDFAAANIPFLAEYALVDQRFDRFEGGALPEKERRELKANLYRNIIDLFKVARALRIRHNTPYTDNPDIAGSDEGLLDEEKKVDGLAPIFEGSLDREFAIKALQLAQSQLGLSQRKFADRLGISEGNLRQVYRGEATIDRSLELLNKIGYRLDVELVRIDP